MAQSLGAALPALGPYLVGLPCSSILLAIVPEVAQSRKQGIGQSANL